MKTVAYQGVKGAFSHMTALMEFGEHTCFKGIPTFKEVFEAVEQKEADYAVIPIENSLIGSIYENYDLLNHYEMHVIGEHFTKIEQCLLTIPTLEMTSIKKVRKVLSHPKALEQCSGFLEKHPWIEAVVYRDTAAAAAEVASLGNPAFAAIASARAGDIYGLESVIKGIEDDPKNYTRFMIVTKQPISDAPANKCSLLFQLKHVSGTLSYLLNLFADKGMNLTKIESRPIHGRPFEYLFYVDFEFDEKKRQDVEELLNALSQVQKLKILGFYKARSL